MDEYFFAFKSTMLTKFFITEPNHNECVLKSVATLYVFHYCEKVHFGRVMWSLLHMLTEKAKISLCMRSLIRDCSDFRPTL